jgi:hypothetical protein
MPQQQFSKSTSACSSRPNHNLESVQFLPPGGMQQVYVALWRECGHVHLASPLMRVHRGVRDPGDAPAPRTGISVLRPPRPES